MSFIRFPTLWGFLYTILTIILDNQKKELQWRLYVRVKAAVATLFTGPKPKEIKKVKTFRSDYLIRTPKSRKVEFTGNKFIT